MLSLLEAFVHVFGLSFKVGDGPLTKFVLYQRIPVAKHSQRTDLISVHNPERHDLVAQQLLRVDSEGFAEVAIAYVIDMTTYGATLKQHGVTLKK